MGPHLIHRVKLCPCQSFRPVAAFFSWAKVSFSLIFFLMQKGVWPCGYAYDIPLVTLILNKMVYLHSFF